MDQQKLIRQASTQDLDMLINWGEKLHDVEKKFEPLLIFSKQDSTDFYKKQLNNTDALFLIAEIDHLPVGYLYAHIDKIDYLDTNKNQCEIEVIFLDEPARGTGISQDLIKECLQWIKTKSCFRVITGIYSQNLASQKLFSKIGFKPYHSTYTMDLD